MTTRINSYRDLTVWKRSFQFVLHIYRLTRSFPRDELYGLVSQIHRATISIPSNIAEGFTRKRKLEYLQFLRIAFGSGAELETQLLLAKELGYLTGSDFREISLELDEVMKMLNSLIISVRAWQFPNS